MSNKRSTKESLHPSLHGGWNIVAMDKVINALFTSGFTNKSNCSWDIQHPELEDKDRQQNKTLK